MAPTECLIKVNSAVNFGDNCWQTSCKGLCARLGSLRERKLWTDCELVVGKERARVSAHRVLLAAASPILATALYGSLAQTHRPVDLSEIDADIFELLLQYFYTDNLKIKSCDRASSLYVAAHALILPQVKEKCRAYLTSHVSVKNAVKLYEFGERYKERVLMDKCMKIMSTDTTAVLNHVEEASASTLARLFAMPNLVIDSELDLLRAAERWLGAQPDYSKEYNGVEDSDREDVENSDHKHEIASIQEDEDKKKLLIRGAVQHIRFLTLDPEEFAENNCSALLNEAEMLAISLNFISPKSHLPMPAGFSSSRESRATAIKITISALEDFTKTESDIHYIRNLPWTLIIEKNYDNKLLLRIQCNENRAMKKWSCWTDMSFRVNSHKWGVPPLIYKASNHKYHFRGFSAYWYRYWQSNWDWHELTDPTRGYVKDGCITVEARITPQLVVYKQYSAAYYHGKDVAKEHQNVRQTTK